MSRRRKEEKIFVNSYIPPASSDFYTKTRLQDILNRPTEYFNNAEKKLRFDLSWFTSEKIRPLSGILSNDY